MDKLVVRMRVRAWKKPSFKNYGLRLKREQGEQMLYNPVLCQWPYSWLGALTFGAISMKTVHGARLRGITITRRTRVWRAVVKVIYKDDFLVGFVESPTLDTLLFRVGQAIGRKGIKWHKDRFA